MQSPVVSLVAQCWNHWPRSAVQCKIRAMYRLGPDFMALLTVKQWIGACGNREFCAYIGQASRVSREFWLVLVLLHVTRHSSRTQLVHKFGACTVSGKCWSHSQNSAVSRAMKLGPAKIVRTVHLLWSSAVVMIFSCWSYVYTSLTLCTTVWGCGQIVK